MAIFKYILLICVTILALSSCEEVVSLPSPASDNYLTVEATLTNLPGPQKILLSKSQAYFDNSAAPKISNAEVQVKDNLGNVYMFKESKELGTYASSGRMRHIRRVRQ
jgi:hypothetical protein